MNSSPRVLALLLLSLLFAILAAAQNPGDYLESLVAAPGVSGYEGVKGGPAELIQKRIDVLRPAPIVSLDPIGNVLVTIEGTGPGPRRWIVAPIDEPGYVVSAITPLGYLRVQRLPQQSPQFLFDALHFAQQVSVLARDGRRIPGVIAGLSVHLQPGRRDAPKMDHPDDMYVDIGASSEVEARQAGVDVLDPVIVDRRLYRLANRSEAGTAVGDRYGAAALLSLARLLNDRKFPGTLTLAFVTQQWLGGRGLRRVLEANNADEMIFVGRLPAPRAPGSGAPAPPRSGLLIGTSDASKPLEGFAAEIQKKAKDVGVKALPAPMGAMRFASSVPAPTFPTRFAHLALPLDWPVTPIETLSEQDLDDLVRLLEYAVRGELPNRGGSAGGIADGYYVPAPHTSFPIEEQLKRLSVAYGASGHEAAVRKEVDLLLPPWAKPETDESGNLILHFAGARPGGVESAPPIVFVAHMDEIGYEVKAIGDDGRLEAAELGGGSPQYFVGHPVLVHGEKSTRDGVIELPAGWDTPQFTWPNYRDGARARVDVGARNRAEAEALGIRVGDWITIEKKYHALAGARANARSFDDRVGCTALVAAAWALGPEIPGRDVTFVWSTEEEVGLRGAASASGRLANASPAAGGPPLKTVFAIDTFVSSDSPLETPRFAHALLGQGFVVRAVDNSNVVPRALSDRVVQIARQHNIPVQYGVTGGGNDGSVFTRFGVVDVALGWPLRYSHSPAEVVDTRDVHALADIVVALAKEW
jgi:putative aminopeptidase FrvX